MTGMSGRHVERRMFVGQNRRRAAGERVGHEARAVGFRAAQRREQKAGLDLAAVGGQAGNGRRSPSRDGAPAPYNSSRVMSVMAKLGYPHAPTRTSSCL